MRHNVINEDTREELHVPFYMNKTVTENGKNTWKGWKIKKKKKPRKKKKKKKKKKKNVFKFNPAGKRDSGGPQKRWKYRFLSYFIGTN